MAVPKLNVFVGQDMMLNDFEQNYDNPRIGSYNNTYLAIDQIKTYNSPNIIPDYAYIPGDLPPTEPYDVIKSDDQFPLGTGGIKSDNQFPLGTGGIKSPPKPLDLEDIIIKTDLSTTDKDKLTSESFLKKTISKVKSIKPMYIVIPSVLLSGGIIYYFMNKK